HAARINVRWSLEDPQADGRDNLMGSLHLLEAALAAKVEHFLFASSGGALYGDQVSRPTPEDAPREPTSPYGIAKLAIEEYLRVLGTLYGLPVVVFRYANVYGPRQIPEGEAGVVGIFAQALLEGRAPTIYGSGENRRDYLYIDDCVSANVLAVEGRATGVFNLGTGVEADVQEVYAAVARAVGTDLTPAPGPERPGEVLASSLDATRFREAYGWAPSVPLHDGIRRTVEWFRSGAER
ncbi:MAG TPA: NAD-dependent epimerase/dehydratase family protein, partial [bacterium]|nr:NAD-dependent epimerase/dehydratase family protein [bacterium]